MSVHTQRTPIVRSFKRRLQITKLSEKLSSPSCQKKFNESEWINLIEETNSSLTNCQKVSEEFNNSFVNVVKNLNIPNYENCDSLVKNINDPTLKATLVSVLLANNF